jgi:hypothetical protein
MERIFNIAGPSKPELNYQIDPLKRLDWEDLQQLMATQRYFVLHAPRQTGKTSTLLAMMAALNAGGVYACAYANIEGAQAARGDETQGIPAACDAMVDSIELYLPGTGLKTWYRENRLHIAPQHLLTALLTHWAQQSAKPVVLLLDEVDALVGDTLISLLRQIRAGYAQRPQAFPQSIVLCGVRDVRDYRMSRGDGEVITGGSAFNIQSKSLLMDNFSKEEVRELFEQHTRETGQDFDEAIYPALWEDTAGQPWLVNALGHELTWENKAARDRSKPITVEDYRQARERLIYSRATHLDQLADKLKEPRVHRVIASILEGEGSELALRDDDLQYAADLGLITRKPQVCIANRIYREVIPRELTSPVQDGITHQQAWYLTPERRLDMPKLLAAFQQFFREHADAWLQQFAYREAGPQLLMQAFLQRIVNGGGRVNREYGLGLRRTDLFVEWPVDEAQGYWGEVQRVVIELKILRKGLEATVAEGLAQTADYASRCGAAEAHLMIFDRTPGKSWDERIWQRQEAVGGRSIGVWGA